MDSKVPLASPAPLPANSSTEVEASLLMAVSGGEEGAEWLVMAVRLLWPAHPVDNIQARC